MNANSIITACVYALFVCMRICAKVSIKNVELYAKAYYNIQNNIK